MEPINDITAIKEQLIQIQMKMESLPFIQRDVNHLRQVIIDGHNGEPAIIKVVAQMEERQKMLLNDSTDTRVTKRHVFMTVIGFILSLLNAAFLGVFGFYHK